MTNDDGYILGLHRIPHGLSQEEPYVEDRPPILFGHGLFASSDSIVYHGPEDSPAFFYANHGYDVWMYNLRGNRYSRNHTTLDPDTDTNFWRFTITNLSKDIRTNIEYIMDVTGYSSIAMFGQSITSTTALVALADDIEFYQDHLSLFLAAGVVATSNHMESQTLATAYASTWFYRILRSYEVYEFAPFNYLQLDFTATMCEMFPFYCDLSLGLELNIDPSIDSPDALQQFRMTYPAG